MIDKEIGSLHINESLVYSGGAEGYILNLAYSLKERGIPVVVSSGREGSIHADLNFHSIPGVHKRTDDESLETNLRTIDRIMKDNDLGVVHFHNVNNSQIVQQIAVEYPTVRTIHDYRMLCPSEFKLLPNGDECLQAMDSYCQACLGIGINEEQLSKMKAGLKATSQLDLCITASDYVKQQLIKNGLRADKIEALPLFLPNEELITPERSNSQYQSDLLFVGRVAKGKGLREAILSLSLLKDNTCLLVCGDGPELAECRKLAEKLELDGRAKFLGWVSRKKLSEYYFNTRIVIVPSIWPEPFGLVGLEAMYYGKPVVAFDSGGVSEWLQDGENGFLIGRGNIDDFTQRINQLLTDPDLCQQMGTKGKSMLENFSVDKHVESLMAIYARVLSR